MLPNSIETAPVLWADEGPGTWARLTRRVLEAVRLTEPPCRLQDLQLQTRCQSAWCWTAVLQEIVRLVGKERVSQCQLAKDHKGAGCSCSGCNPSVESSCNELGQLETFLEREKRLESWRFQTRATSSLTQTDLGAICEALEKNRPVVVRFGSGSQNHYMMIASVSLNPLQLGIADPADASILTPLGFQEKSPLYYEKDWELEAITFASEA